jgi:hypothetical protein
MFWLHDQNVLCLGEIYPNIMKKIRSNIERKTFQHHKENVTY